MVAVTESTSTGTAKPRSISTVVRAGQMGTSFSSRMADAERRHGTGPNSRRRPAAAQSPHARPTAVGRRPRAIALIRPTAVPAA